jgi:hyperosmotically inducible protein
VDDSVITTRVKSALLDNIDIKSFDIKVETRKGEVMLSGFVDNQTQVDHAVKITNGIEGVKGVDNKLTLKEGVATVGNKIDDGVITTKIKSALLADASIKSVDIMVVTRKGEVQLSGFVNNQAQIDRALEVTHGIEGVTKVSNDMSIKK